MTSKQESYPKASEISQETIDRVKKVPIQQFLPPKFRKVGNKLVYLCPFPDHNEKKPSFTVYLKTNTYKCYGCGRYGDSIQFILDLMGWDKKNQKDFINAIEYLKKYA